MASKQRYGIAANGPHKGELTACNSKDPDHCKNHLNGSHEMLTPKQAEKEQERISEDRARKSESNKMSKAAKDTRPVDELKSMKAEYDKKTALDERMSRIAIEMRKERDAADENGYTALDGEYHFDYINDFAIDVGADVSDIVNIWSDNPEDPENGTTVVKFSDGTVMSFSSGGSGREFKDAKSAMEASSNGFTGDVAKAVDGLDFVTSKEALCEFDKKHRIADEKELARLKEQAAITDDEINVKYPIVEDLKSLENEIKAAGAEYDALYDKREKEVNEVLDRAMKDESAKRGSLEEQHDRITSMLTADAERLQYLNDQLKKQDKGLGDYVTSKRYVSSIYQRDPGKYQSAFVDGTPLKAEYKTWRGNQRVKFTYKNANGEEGTITFPAEMVDFTGLKNQIDKSQERIVNYRNAKFSDDKITATSRDFIGRHGASDWMKLRRSLKIDGKHLPYYEPADGHDDSGWDTYSDLKTNAIYEAGRKFDKKRADLENVKWRNGQNKAARDRAMKSRDDARLALSFNERMEGMEPVRPHTETYFNYDESSDKAKNTYHNKNKILSSMPYFQRTDDRPGSRVDLRNYDILAVNRKNGDIMLAEHSDRYAEFVDRGYVPDRVHTFIVNVNEKR